MLKKICIVLLAYSVVVHGAAITDGSLDGSFGTSGIGIVTTDFGGTDVAQALIVQPDGKLVAAGSAGTDFALARYNPDGSLDTSFGTNGKVTTDIVGGSEDQAEALIVQPDGKLVAAGLAGADFALARYNPDGSLDTSFGTNGKVTTDFGGADVAKALILQPDGKLVAAGSAGTDFALARYNTDGSLDSSFGTNGKVTTDFSGGSDFAYALILQPDGKFVAAGEAGSDFALARYNSDGSLDNSFGTNGKVTTNFAGGDAANALILQPDGKLVAAGGTGTGDFALARYNADGSLDTSFGTSGLVTTDFAGGADEVFALILQPDGKLVAAGKAVTDFALARYNADGSLDASFGTSGKVTTDFAGGTDEADALIVQPDGKLVAAGKAGSDFGLARYLIPSLEISLVARDIRAKYRIVLPFDRNGTEYEI